MSQRTKMPRDKFHPDEDRYLAEKALFDVGDALSVALQRFRKIDSEWVPKLSEMHSWVYGVAYGMQYVRYANDPEAEEKDHLRVERDFEGEVK